MNRRSETVVNMELLALLLEGPRGPSRICQALNLNFNKFLEMATYQESKGFIRREADGAREVYFVTDKGRDLYNKWTEFYRAFGENTYLK